MKQWLTLSRLELINLFGINVYRHEKDLVLLASLPLKSLPIVSARLLKSYLESMMVCAGVLLPSFTLYAIFMKPGILFYVGIPFVLLFLPILPTALAA